ncbi:hypothetical protein JCM8547_002401 [Rhodosporidiobolus lusitaniae]
MARSKARKVVHPARPVAIQATPTHPSPSEDDEPAPKKARKGRSAASKVRGKTGAMAVFNSLPLDLIYEICLHLTPVDLHALSNTSKVFRSVVTGNASKPLWVSAREAAGLPELELAMTDLQYAHLMHGKGCTFCTRKNAGKADTYFRARICTACLKEHFANNTTTAGHAALMKATDSRLHSLTLMSCTPTSPARGGPFYYIPEIKKMNAFLRQQDADNRDPEADPARDFIDNEWLDRQFVSQRRYPQPGEEPREPTTPFQKWYDKGEKDRKARYADGDKLRDWMKDQDNAKSSSKDDIRKKRLEDISVRLKQQGFHESELKVWEFVNDQIVRKPDLVTERTWPRIEEACKEKLLSIRRRARQSRFEQAYGTFKRTHLDGSSFPPSELIDQIPTVQDLLDDCATYVPGDELFEAHKDAISDEIMTTLVRPRREAILRAIGKSYVKLRENHEKEKKGKEVSTSVNGLKYSDVKLPRLPPWIPRSDDAPLAATHAQIRTFLDNDIFASLECHSCQEVFQGQAVLEHTSRRWGCFSHGYATSEPKPLLEDWATVGPAATPVVGTYPPGSARIRVDEESMLLVLRLHQVMDAAAFEEDEEQEKEAEEAGVKMDEKDKFATRIKCKCQKHGWQYEFEGSSMKEAYRHVRSRHYRSDDPSVALNAETKYSRQWLNKLYDAGLIKNRGDARDPYDVLRGYDEDLDMYGHFGLAASMAYDSYDEESEEEMMRRGDCVVM